MANPYFGNIGDVWKHLPILELMRVDVDRPGLVGELDVDRDPLSQRSVEQVGHASDQLRRVDPLG